ncbi:sulfatase-like hydrolase/transferase [Variovorax arabinosiphilus]|uniref:sulfatase-like hydrolase/transferase n=1 Tax=Variovorax arabinosiphilus TaxID=3053498 RepID=UPI00257859EE|nr:MULTISPECIES: sulfatase-like hydrolase/transferase [unclassified Variovorax]MDM0122395.1 sulfatase-like hydrolase/transferase [Variovorax sp. J2L1-78]MDM0131076.1 sulfatase-like hydrolase/transferase [Variovorax sp. J2L1-63]MDM0235158.1 sulfatase-like hydrolase/transferase [Variovorax sp. J2R1-6]
MRKPNLIFILADDLGWGDLSCYGRPDYQTPHLDRLASEGARLTDCYSGSATCSPTRISFFTGRYPARHPAGLAEPLLHGIHGSTLGLEPGFPALPRLLSQAGYRCGLFGKWHCGEGGDFGPLKSGFDEFYGVESTGAAYFSYRDESGRFLGRDGEAESEPGRYLTHALSDRASDFIARNCDQPFYLSLHYTAPHWLWEAPFHDSEDAVERSSGTGGGSIAIYAEMMRALDEGVGQVLDTVRRLGLDGDTLVVFTSDNGGERYSYHYPLTGYIRLLREGGIRVPGIVRWPGRIPAAQVCDQVAITMDWTATFLAAAAARPDPAYPLDGVDLLPVLAGEMSCFERTLYWRTPTASAVRRGPWKWLNQLDTGAERLFNLKRDVREYADFRDTHPDILASLREAFSAWEQEMLPRPSPVSQAPNPNIDFKIY